MGDSRVGGTKRVRRIRRVIRRLARDREWLERRIPKETDRARWLELREALASLQREGAPRLGGIQYQESRLPSINGPDDCLECHMVVGARVPIASQRIFEDGLRVTGFPPETVWEMREYRPPDQLIGKGRGQVSIKRCLHSEHAAGYIEWKSQHRTKSDTEEQA